jgi:hypothetical protein
VSVIRPRVGSYAEGCYSKEHENILYEYENKIVSGKVVGKFENLGTFPCQE